MLMKRLMTGDYFSGFQGRVVHKGKGASVSSGHGPAFLDKTYLDGFTPYQGGTYAAQMTPGYYQNPTAGDGTGTANAAGDIAGYLQGNLSNNPKIAYDRAPGDTNPYWDSYQEALALRRAKEAELAAQQKAAQAAAYYGGGGGGGGGSGHNWFADEDLAMAQYGSKGAGSGSIISDNQANYIWNNGTVTNSSAQDKAISDLGSVKQDDGSYDISSWYNSGAYVEDPWAPKPIAVSHIQPMDLGEARQMQQMQELVGDGGAGATKDMLLNAYMGSTPGKAKMDKMFSFNTGGSVDHMNPVNKKTMSAGEWVGKRCKYLNDGGMAVPEAEMQAYNEMQGLTGPGTTGASAMMPESAPMPEEYTPQNDYGYTPTGGPSYKEIMEHDKLMIQRKNAVADEGRKTAAFDKAEARKDQTHQLAMQQKQESHAESMKQKRAGPLSGGAS